MAKEAKSKATPGKTNKNLNDAKWRTSDAKKVVAQAFIDGIIPLELEPDIPLNTKDTFDSLFKNHPDFIYMTGGLSGSGWPSINDKNGPTLTVLLSKRTDVFIQRESTIQKERSIGKGRRLTFG